MALELRPQLRKTALACGVALLVSAMVGGASFAAGGAMDVYAKLTMPAGTAMGSGTIYSLDVIKADAKVRAELPAVDIEGLKFKSGSAKIAAADEAKIADVAAAIGEILAVRPFEVFLVEGHTDATGSDAVNKRISEARANAIADALMAKHGIPARNLAVVGYGEEFLIVDTKKAEPRNRRVTIRRVTDLMDPLK